MKFLKWKILTATSLVCLLPILFGLALWDNLPDTMAIHFDVYGNPDNFASKGFVVFGLPVMMVLLQFFCCVINDVNAWKFGDRTKLELVTKWIIPIMSVVLQIITLGYGMGWNIDVRKAVAFLVGCIFIVIGNYMPKFSHIKNYDVETQKARKINRFVGILSVVMGILYFISIFLPPIATVICLFLMIPYAIISVIYGIKVGKGEKV